MRRHTRLTPPGNRRDAELFFADLAGRPRHRRHRPPPPPDVTPAPLPSPLYPRAGQIPRQAAPATTPTPVHDDDDAAEAVPQRGRGAFRHDPLGGIRGNNVEARWNVDSATASGSTIDIVVHLHGFSDHADDAGFLAMKAAAAGVDLVDDAGVVRVRASRPTLALVPRGRHVSDDVWVFDRLPDQASFDGLVDAGLRWLCVTVLGLPAGSTLVRGRVTLAAHSGGGAALSALLNRSVNPDEVICFDSMYGGEGPIQQWAERRIAASDAARYGLRVFYTPCWAPSTAHPSGRWVRTRDGRDVLDDTGSWSYRSGGWQLITTEVSARRLQHAIERALSRAAGGAALVNRFRVQRTTVRHLDIPARYSPLLLEDIAADVPQTRAPSARPECVDNEDWLTRARKPGGNDPPPPRPAPPGRAEAI